jgi:hypothetical protein
MLHSNSKRESKSSTIIQQHAQLCQYALEILSGIAVHLKAELDTGAWDVLLRCVLGVYDALVTQVRVQWVSFDGGPSL